MGGPTRVSFRDGGREGEKEGRREGVLDIPTIKSLAENMAAARRRSV